MKHLLKTAFSWRPGRHRRPTAITLPEIKAGISTCVARVSGEEIEGPLNILVPCERIVPTGGLLRFERLAEALKHKGHRIVFCPRKHEGGNDLFVTSDVMDFETAAQQSWHAVMVPGAGFSEETMIWLSAFQDSRFGLRVQHVLNDSSRYDSFLRVNRAIRPDYVIFNNPAWERVDFTQFHARQFHTIPGAVDSCFFTRQKSRNEEVVRVVGQARKTPEPLIEAIRGMPGNVKLILFGKPNSDLAMEYSDLVAAGRLELVGILDKSELRNLYESSDVCVHLEENAGWANMAAEAMAMEVPLVCTPAGTECFARDGENAFVIDQADIEQIRVTINRVIKNKEEARSRARIGRETIDQYDWNSYSDSMLSLLKGFPESHYGRDTQGNLFGKWPIHERFEGLEDLFEKMTGKTVLDLGAAEGHSTIACARHGAAHVIGLEFDADRVALGNAFLAEQGLNGIAELHVADLSRWPEIPPFGPGKLTAKYDVVLYLGIHHHLGDGRMKTLKGALEKAGQVFAIRTPSRFWERDEIDRVIRDQGWTPCEDMKRVYAKSAKGDLYVYRRA